MCNKLTIETISWLLYYDDSDTCVRLKAFYKVLFWLRKVLLLLREMINTKQVISSKNFKMCFFNNILINFKTKNNAQVSTFTFCAYVTISNPATIALMLHYVSNASSASFCLCITVCWTTTFQKDFLLLLLNLFCKGVMF